MTQRRKKKKVRGAMVAITERGPTIAYREFDPTYLNQKIPKKKGRPKLWAHDPIGSVNVRRSTLEKIHRIREMMSDENRVPLHVALDMIVQFYLDCAGDGASQKIPEHSRQERMP